MKRHERTSPAKTTDLKRRRLLAFAGLAGLSRTVGAHEKAQCLLSLREADFYAPHDLAG